MNTATHLLTAAAALARPHRPVRNTAVLIGALLPDAWIFGFWGWYRVQGVPELRLWRELYWQEPWQTIGAAANSAPLAVTLLSVGLWARLSWLAVLAGAMLIHLALDFPVHADDAHRHFWPLSDWRLHAPLSYWDVRYHADKVIWVEAALTAACLVILWRRFGGRPARAALTLLAMGYLGAYAYFAWVF
ncbi:MAG: cobalamin biosynthesis protein CobQ [Pseudomonadota bacterium]